MRPPPLRGPQTPGEVNGQMNDKIGRLMAKTGGGVEHRARVLPLVGAWEEAEKEISVALPIRAEVQWG